MIVRVFSALTYINLVFAPLPLQVCAQETSLLKLAVLRINFEDFSEDEMAAANRTFYQYIKKDQRITVISEAQSRTRLIPLGIEPREISDVAGYVHAGQILRADFVLVGHMDKIGSFVEVTFRVFTMPRGTQKQYPGGKTFELLLEKEIPQIIENIYRDMRLEKSQDQSKVKTAPPEEQIRRNPVKKSRKKIWLWLVIGGVVSGVSTALLLGNGEASTQESNVLPQPPIVPK